jgi:glycosyl transferase family 25
MQVYVINLNRSADRLSQIKDQLERLNLPFKRVEAIDGNQLEIEKSRVNHFKFNLSQNRRCENRELGCAESHRKVWNEIIESGDRYALILEDDVILPKPRMNFFIKLKKTSS